MNRVRFAVVFAVVLLAGTGIGYWLATERTSVPPAPTAHMSAETHNETRRVLYWHDPMVPNTRFDKPGKSPFMDMQLVPVYADEEGAGAAVHVSSNVAQSLGIRVGKVERKSVQSRLSTVGSIVFDERQLQVIQARTEGYLIKLYIKAPLDPVRKGQPLADILSPQWRTAQEEYLALLGAQSERGQPIRDAARQRLPVLGMPHAAIAALEKDRTAHATTTLTAPSEGVVSELSVREGATFAAGAPLFRINSLKTVWANAQVPEAQASMVKSGARVTAHATAWPGEAFAGHVLAILPNVDAQTRTLPVRIALDNPAHKLAPGMFVSLEFIAPMREAQLVVPSEAVIMTGARNAVIVAREGGGFDVADVTPGAEVDGETAILSGLTEGQSIVLSGQFLIDSEASLRSTVSRLADAPGDSAQQTERP